MLANPESDEARAARNVRKAERNVLYALSILFIFSVALGIFQGPIFDKYIFQLGGDGNAYVGLVDSINGVVSLLVLGPVAMLVDRRVNSRAPLISQACAVGIFSTSAFAYSITLDNLWVLYVALASNGIYFELMMSAMGALYTDSAILLGRLQELTVRQSVVMGIGNCIGPILSLILLISSGDPGSELSRPPESGFGHKKLWSGRWGPEQSRTWNWVAGAESGPQGVADPHGVALMRSDMAAQTPAEAARVSSARSGPYTRGFPWDGGLFLLDGPERGPQQWSLSFIHTILLSGLLLFVPMLILTLLFRDLEVDGNGDTYGKEVEDGGAEGTGVPSTNPPGRQGSLAAPTVQAGDPLERLLSSESNWSNMSARRESFASAPTLAGGLQERLLSFESNRSGPMDGGEEDAVPDTSQAQEEALEFYDEERRGLVPYFVAASDFVSCVAGGLSCKFVNLYLINEFRLAGKHMAVVQLLQNVVVVLSISGGAWLSRRYLSRMRVSLLSVVVFIVALSLVSWLPADSDHLPVILVCLLTSQLGGARSALDKSIVYECTDSSERGKWNAISGLTSTMWGGSAFVGGYLADSWGYQEVFSFAAKLQCLAILTYSPILWIIKDKPLSQIWRS